VFNELWNKQTGYQLLSNITKYLVIVILMAASVCTAEHHLTILQKRNLSTCSAVT
jgi:hypothetical protein